MMVRFDDNGHVMQLAPRELLAATSTHTDRVGVVRRALFRATPHIFPTVSHYCNFVDAISNVLRVHPHNVHVRGSGLLGYSITPRPDKAWKPVDNTTPGRISDIDIAVADVDLFDMWTRAADEWDRSNPISPKTGGAARQKYYERSRQRRSNCIWSESLSGDVCGTEKASLGRFKTQPFCGKDRSISVLVFRDWSSLENRCVNDLKELWEAKDRLSQVL